MMNWDQMAESLRYKGQWLVEHGDNLEAIYAGHDLHTNSNGVMLWQPKDAEPVRDVLRRVAAYVRANPGTGMWDVHDSDNRLGVKLLWASNVHFVITASKDDLVVSERVLVPLDDLLEGAS